MCGKSTIRCKNIFLVLLLWISISTCQLTSIEEEGKIDQSAKPEHRKIRNLFKPVEKRVMFPS